MHKTTSPVSAEKWRQIDKRLKREDEDRWLSSRYAASDVRKRLVALYAFNLELARVRSVVSEPGLGAIRFQWWRDVMEEIDGEKGVRAHDVAQLIYATGLSTKTMRGLIDGHEAAFEAGDRSLEPEALLMRAAAAQLATAHAWGEHIASLAPAYAATRRGETEEAGPVFTAVPSAIRPALAHAVLRFHYILKPPPSALGKRFAVMKAMFSGRV